MVLRHLILVRLPLMVLLINKNDMNLGGSNTASVPLENEELVYDVELLPHDPEKRINIIDYPSNQRNKIRRAYILKNPYQQKLITSLKLMLEGRASVDSLLLGLINEISLNIVSKKMRHFVLFITYLRMILMLMCEEMH